MNSHDLSRRNLMVAGTGLATAAFLSAQTSGSIITAGEVIDRIKKNVGIPWRGSRRWTASSWAAPIFP